MRTIAVILQKILVKIFLFLTYILVFGITFIFLKIIGHKLLKEKSKEGSTFWKHAKGYKPDMQECFDQS
jgi:hypothetical protein